MVQKISVVSVKLEKGNTSKGITFLRKIPSGMNRSIWIRPGISVFSIQMVSAQCLLSFLASFSYCFPYTLALIPNHVSKVLWIFILKYQFGGPDSSLLLFLSKTTKLMSWKAHLHPTISRCSSAYSQSKREILELAINFSEICLVSVFDFIFQWPLDLSPSYCWWAC